MACSEICYFLGMGVMPNMQGQNFTKMPQQSMMQRGMQPMSGVMQGNGMVPQAGMMGTQGGMMNNQGKLSYFGS